MKPCSVLGLLNTHLNRLSYVVLAEYGRFISKYNAAGVVQVQMKRIDPITLKMFTTG